MDLLEQTKNLCRLYDIKPVRSRGQIFLIKEKIHDDVVAAADLRPDDFILEVGPGLGVFNRQAGGQSQAGGGRGN